MFVLSLTFKGGKQTGGLISYKQAGNDGCTVGKLKKKRQERKTRLERTITTPFKKKKNSLHFACLAVNFLGRTAEESCLVWFVYHSNIREESMAEVLPLLALKYYHTIKLQALLAPPLNRHG